MAPGAILNGGGEVSPPSTCGSTKLLSREQGLLDLGALQKPKLGLNDAKPVIRLQWINCLGKRQRVHRQEVSVGCLHPWLAVGGALYVSGTYHPTSTDVYQLCISHLVVKSNTSITR
jgi:hypothetical protein